MKHLFLVVLLAFASNIFASEADKTALANLGYSSDHIAKLLQKGNLSANYKKAEDLTFKPKSNLFDSTYQSLVASKPSIIVETVYYLPSKLNVSLQAYNKIIDAKSLSGVKSSDGKFTIAQAYKVAEVGSETALASDSVTAVPNSLSYLIMQKDDYFSGVAYFNTTVNYDSGTGSLAVNFANAADMHKGLIKTATPGQHQVSLLVLPLIDGTLIYATESNIKSPPAFIRKGAIASLLNRLDAFKNWLVSSAS